MYLGAVREDGLEGVEAFVEPLPTLALGYYVLQLVPRRLGRLRRLLLVVVLLLLLMAVPHLCVHLVEDRHGRLEHSLPTCWLRQSPPGGEAPLVALERARARGRHPTRRHRRGRVLEVCDEALVVVGEHNYGHRS